MRTHNTPTGKHTQTEINIVLDFRPNLNPIMKLIQTVTGFSLIYRIIFLSL